MNKTEAKYKGKKEPWPTKDAMEQIYEQHLWGGVNFEFYSGEGSHEPKYLNPYVDTLSTFLNSFEEPLTVCDLGCGDFNVGKELIEYSKEYIAVDIVESLIERNRRSFKDERLEFHCLDIAVDSLPVGDCAILRQVLQHLSNAEIRQIVPKLSNYRFVIVTEHIPEGAFDPNLDIISGQGIRLKKQSGVDLLAPPFCLKVKESKQLLEIPYDEGKGILKTTLYEM